MLLPSIENGSGPFPSATGGWFVREPRSPGERFAAASFYCAMMTATCLHLIGADGPVIVEGPFAANSLYLDMLAANCGRPVLRGAGSATGTAIGAAMLCRKKADAPEPQQARHADRKSLKAYQRYSQLWSSKVSGNT
jgi:sugar (pentulose or hexulose) kinase